MNPETLLLWMGVLICAAWGVMDLRWRRVWNLALMAPILVAVPFLAWFIIEEPTRALMQLVQFASMTVVAVLLWMAGALGGADVKGIIVLSVILPAADYGPPGLFALMDAFLFAYVASSAWLFATKKKGAPFFAFLAPSLASLALWPGFLWLPLTWVAQWLVRAL